MPDAVRLRIDGCAIRALPAVAEPSGDLQRVHVVGPLDRHAIPLAGKVCVDAPDRAGRLPRACGVREERLAGHLRPRAPAVEGEHHDRVLSVQRESASVEHLHPGRVIVVRVDDDLPVMVDPGVVVRSRLRVEDGEPVEAVLRGRVVVPPRFGALAARVAVRAGSAVAEIREPDAERDPVSVRQRSRGADHRRIGMCWRCDSQDAVRGVGRVRRHLREVVEGA